MYETALHEARRRACVASSKGRIAMTNIYACGLVARWALMLGISSLALSGCKGNAQPQAPPPPEVSVIDVRPGPVTVYNEYVAQTQAPDTIEIRSQFAAARILMLTAYDGDEDIYKALQAGAAGYVLKSSPGEKLIPADVATQTSIFFALYFAMTGMHALHMIIGVGILIFLIYRASHGAYPPHHYTMVENFGLYWHFVDIIWIFLFPLLYLVSRSPVH